jgi:hypothetical protein
MKKLISELSDLELIELAGEMNKNSTDENSILRKIIGEEGQYITRVLEVNVILVQVLTDRLITYSPYLNK